MWQVLFTLPISTPWSSKGLPLYGFGLMLFLAFLICTWLAGKRAPREGIHPDTVQDIAVWILLGGLLGARLMSMFSLGIYPTSLSGVGDWFWKLIAIWEGGIVLYGAVLGGLIAFFLAYFLFYRAKKLSILHFLDTVAPAIALGLVFGRFGCFLNGCCYGMVACSSCVAVTPVSFPLCAPPREALVETGCQTVAGFTCELTPPEKRSGVVVDRVDPSSPAYEIGLRKGSIITAVNDQPIKSFTDINSAFHEKWPRGQSYLDLTFIPAQGEDEITRTLRPGSLGLYPTQLYEVVSMFLLFLVLMAYYPLRYNPGQVCAVLMIGYGLHRYLNELLRDDPRPKGIESYGSVILIVGGIALWGWLWGMPPMPQPAPPPPDEPTEKPGTPAGP